MRQAVPHCQGAAHCLSFLALDDSKPPIQMPGSSEYDASGGVQDPATTGPRGPGPHDQIPPNKPPWFDQPHPVAPWGQQQVFLQTCGRGRWGVLGLKGWQAGGRSPVQVGGLLAAPWETSASAAGSRLGESGRAPSSGGVGTGQSKKGSCVPPWRFDYLAFSVIT